MYAVGAGRSDVGRVRDNNEDAFVVDNDLGLFVVSDGMGGHQGGEVASSTAIEVVRTALQAQRSLIDRVRDRQADAKELASAVETAIHEASRKVHEIASAGEGLAGMGCTLTLLVVVEDRAVLGHVGDSRLYLLRDDAVHQLSADHTFAQEFVRNRAMSLEDAKKSRYAHVLTRAIGSQELVQVDTLVFDLLPADRLLLCSDGLSEYVGEPESVKRALQGSDLDEVADGLVTAANEAGGRDNITVVVVDIEADAPERPAVVSMNSDVQIKLDALSSVFLFEDLPLAQLSRVLQFGSAAEYTAGDVILAGGGALEGLMIVVEGRFEYTPPQGAAKALGPGEHIGAPALLSADVPAGALKALDTGRILLFPHQRFLGLVRGRPWLGVQLLERLGRHLGDQLR